MKNQQYLSNGENASFLLSVVGWKVVNDIIVINKERLEMIHV
jgi:hypothetical protein